VAVGVNKKKLIKNASQYLSRSQNWQQCHPLLLLPNVARRLKLDGSQCKK
jgi:hypothetical protein